MLEKKRRRPYWRETKALVVMALVVPGSIMLILPLMAEQADRGKVLGLPASYFLAAFAPLLVALVSVFRFIRKQDDIDHWHGAHEDL